MKDIHETRLTVAEANAKLGVAMDPKFWGALVGLIEYPELAYDQKSETIRFPSYVPFAELAAEWIEGIEQGIYDVRPCLHCDSYFDMNRTEGIFSDAEELEGFICMPCAEAMTAREFYETYLTLR